MRAQRLAASPRPGPTDDAAPQLAPPARAASVVGMGLMLMSFSSGCMDIMSFRFLGQVFASAMTGNLALMGLYLGQGDLSGTLRSMAAFASFAAGLAAGALLLRGGADRRGLLRTLVLEAALLLLFALGLRDARTDLYLLIAVSALAMGVQSAAAHRIGVSGISTTYFTGTLTGIVFGLVGPGSSPPLPAWRRIGWPLLALAAYLAGALLAGWRTAGVAAPELPIALPFLPLAAILVLSGMIAASKR